MRSRSVIIMVILLFTMVSACKKQADKSLNAKLRKEFANPPDHARPGVYWYFMDGNLSAESMTADLESMKRAGIGHVLFLEVNVGIPRGKVDFLSEEWQNLFVHAVRECERLGIAMTLGVGPGWTGSGGPWVTGGQSMKHLVHSSVQVKGRAGISIQLPIPDPMSPYFGKGNFTPELSARWSSYYEDVTVLAFPTPEGDERVQDIHEKALYYREPFTSKPGVKPFLPSASLYRDLPPEKVIHPDKIVNVTRLMKPDGTLDWEVPAGNWTIMRFGARNNGALTRPAPLPGVGFEADKLDTSAINAHLAHFTGKLLQKTGIPDPDNQGGLKMLHMDSWEMGAQNWTSFLRDEFIKRRGYDPLPFYPVYSGLIVGSPEKSERFLWDLRQTAQELVIENHAEHLKRYAHRYHMGFSVEPYDMNPTADMELGAVADVPMCEFWSQNYGYNSSFSCIQAASIAHIEGKNVVAAEAFTAHRDAWKQYPGSMKNQGDWAFAAGVNRLMFHTFQHQSLHDSLKPGMTMGPYGVHHDRGQTWWPMADGYHKYLTRCQYLLQQGRGVADILYLTPEGAPQVFMAPESALTNDQMPDKTPQSAKDDDNRERSTKAAFLPDRKGYNFSGCAPSQLMKASVSGGRILFPSGASFRLLVLPAVETMTPALLGKIESLVKEGAVIIGNPPLKSPGLQGFPECDRQVNETATALWGEYQTPDQVTELVAGKGKIFRGGALSKTEGSGLYPGYDSTIMILRKSGIPEDFVSDQPLRYSHRILPFGDLYFVSNKTNQVLTAHCLFRVERGAPELWDPMSGEIRSLPEFSVKEGKMEIPLQFDAYESYFIFFNQNEEANNSLSGERKNFSPLIRLSELEAPWKVKFRREWGGPAEAVFTKLEDWTTRPEEGIRYYSGIALYENTFILQKEIPADKKSDLYIDLGEVYHLARVKVNGKDMGVVWTPPFRLRITGAVITGNNRVEIEVANLWPNRLIGDEQKPDDGIQNRQWPEWLLKGQPRTSGRYTFTTLRHYKADSPLLKSGLLGPVTLLLTKSN